MRMKLLETQVRKEELIISNEEIKTKILRMLQSKAGDGIELDTSSLQTLL